MTSSKVSYLPVNVKMKFILNILRFLIILSVIPLLAGCPKRQTTLRLVYVPPPSEAPAPSPSSATKQSGAIVIEAPPLPQPAAAHPKPIETPATVEPPKTQPPNHTSVHSVTDDANSEPPPAASEAAPPLEPPTSTEEQVALETRVLDLKQDLQHRIAMLSRLSLSQDDRKALQDARRFLSQTDQAMKQGDFQQSLNLAQKADLLIEAVEKRH